MNVVFCTDNNYIMPCGIAMISLLENNSHNDVIIHIVGKELTSKNKSILEGIVSKYNTAIQFYTINDDQLSKYKLPPTANYINISTYIRLFLFDILPTPIEKIIYLDCDLVVVDDLIDLWNTNIENYSIAGVIDSTDQIEKAYLDSQFNPQKSYTYINAGVLLMNLNYWREKNILEELLLYAEEKPDKILYADQDMLNGALTESITKIPVRYNVHMALCSKKYKVLSIFQKEIDEGLKDRAITHYTTSMKPWLKGCTHPFKKDFLLYKAISPWKDLPITWGNIPRKVRRRFYKRLILGKLGIKKYRPIQID